MPTIKRSNVLSVAATVLAGLSLILFSGALDPVQAAGVGKDGTIAAKKGKAKTLDELIAMYDSSSCIECHEDTHNEWANSAHAKSVYGTGRVAATFKTAFTNGFLSWAYSGVTDPKDVEVEHLMGCTKCHLPQLADATDEVAKEFVGVIYDLLDANKRGDSDTFQEKKDLLLKLNINCMVCHNRNAIVHKWTDGYPQAGVVYGSSDGAHDDPDTPIMKTSHIMGEAIQCGQCHGLGPNLELDNPTQCATGYGSYLFSYIPGGGDKTCQECHMREGGLGHNIQSYRSKVMTDKAVEWHVNARPMSWLDGRTIRPKLMVDVSMTNRAGHGIPDG